MQVYLHRKGPGSVELTNSADVYRMCARGGTQQAVYDVPDHWAGN